MDRQTEMEAFVAVVEAGGFTAAGRRLRLTPSAVSKQVARLEERLGVALLLRTTRGVQPSESGALYFERARSLLAELERLDRDVTHLGDAPSGLVRVSAPPMIAQAAIIDLVPDFLAAHARVSLSLQLSDQYVDLVRDRFDVAVRVGALDPASFVARHVGRLKRVVLASPSYLERYGVPLQPEDLVEHNCLSIAVNDGAPNRWSFQRDGTRFHVDVEGRFECDNAKGVYEAALAGVGITRLSTLVVGKSIAAGHLVPLLEPYADPQGTAMQVIYPSARHPSLAAKVFADALVERLRRALDYQSK